MHAITNEYFTNISWEIKGFIIIIYAYCKCLFLFCNQVSRTFFARAYIICNFILDITYSHSYWTLNLCPVWGIMSLWTSLVKVFSVRILPNHLNWWMQLVLKKNLFCINVTYVFLCQLQMIYFFVLATLGFACFYVSA